MRLFSVYMVTEELKITQKNYFKGFIRLSCAALQHIWKYTMLCAFTFGCYLL